MTDRLVDMFDDHIKDTHVEWELDRESFARSGHRIESPVEPCNMCGKRVYLMLKKGSTRPVWLQLGQIEHADTLFPTVSQKRHQCGDGESWSVEAALFVETALVEWGVIA